MDANRKPEQKRWYPFSQEELRAKAEKRLKVGFSVVDIHLKIGWGY